ncbi:MAG: energy-coupled thiamine transporter ThiT [Clostridia bacterium]|nr:energy-coupled thiamine transporter ThiT [Clostridia bacterium]
MFSNLLSSTYAVDRLEPVALWLTVGFISALLLTALILVFIDKKSLGKFAKAGLISFALYALVLGILMLVLEICKKYSTAYLEDNWVSLNVVTYVFIPLLCTLVVALCGGLVLFALVKKKIPVKRYGIMFGAILGAFTIVTLVLMGVYHSNNVQGDGYYTDPEYGNLNPAMLYLFAGLVVVFTVIVAFVVGRKNKRPFDTRCIATAGICVALSFALSFIKLWDMPTGGSVTLVSLLPVTLFAYIYGMKKGLLVGLLYGVLQAVQDPWLIHPAQFILDYPIAFSMVCFGGLFSDLNLIKKPKQLNFALSATVAGSLRFFCHVLSGVFAFGAYAKDAGVDNFWSYSLVYNCYVFIDIAMVIAVGIFILSSKNFNREIDKMRSTLN